MASESIQHKRIAFLATDGVEQVELTDPWEAVKSNGAQPELISIKSGEIQGMNHDEKADTFDVDKLVSEVRANDYDALVLPGGVANPDKLRMNEDAVCFVRDFFEQHKPVAAICHGPWMLVEADVVEGRTLTSYPSLKTDICNAGGKWVDREVVVDEGLITSRNPHDLPAFIAKMVEEIAEGPHEGQHVGAGASGQETAAVGRHSGEKQQIYDL
ncbi:MAG TPA: type 1 glutamine amidotransferase domain-containing protein [Lacipirellulaceae bacterium]|nr:type 1 glutamine amidotransferase domain-containing protein [Lacipirellulaceae bacterium]